MAHGGTFGTVINCMDGRVQLPVIEWMKQKYGVDYVDSITEPGPVRILGEGKEVPAAESIRRRLDVSVGKHGSKVVALVAHHDCAGNPVSKEQQLKHLAAAIKMVDEWGFRAAVLGLWVDERWIVHAVSED
jgi:carbonic anhydrase